MPGARVGGAAAVLAELVPDATGGDAADVLPGTGEVVDQGLHPTPALDVGVETGDLLLHERGAQPSQVLPEPLLEGSPHRLAVVGQRDEVVAPWRGRGEPGEDAEHLVQRLQRRQGLQAWPAGMVGHLVVVDVVDVDGFSCHASSRRPRPRCSCREGGRC